MPKLVINLIFCLGLLLLMIVSAKANQIMDIGMNEATPVI